MTESTHKPGMSRRDLIKRSAITGGLVWAAPTILSSTPAWAQTSGTCDCGPSPAYFGVKFHPGQPCESLSSDTQCSWSALYPGLELDGSCLCIFLEPDPNYQHDDDDVTISVKPQYRDKVKIVAGGRQGGGRCPSKAVTGTNCTPDGKVCSSPDGRVTITECHTFFSDGPQNSHVQLVLCIKGTLPEGCP